MRRGEDVCWGVGRTGCDSFNAIRLQFKSLILNRSKACQSCKLSGRSDATVRSVSNPIQSIETDPIETNPIQ